MEKKIMDGCTAATYVAYAMSDVATIYPITPIAEMGEIADRWSVQGRKNLMGQVMLVRELESELGAAGATHGALCGGALATTFTSSQGLMLMIPNMYRMAGEMLPAVFHVGTRVVGTHALSIFGDHSDVMECRATGFSMLVSDSVQATHDLAIVAHLSAIDSSLPVLHFFDGWRTANETQTIDVAPYEDIKPLVDWDKVQQFRDRAMNPEKPNIRGTAQNADIYFQNVESRNRYHMAVPAIVQANMDKVAKLTGHQYHLFDYVGHPEAEYVTVSMGSSSSVIEQTVNALVKAGAKVGHVKVRLFRPFDTEAFLTALPKSAKVVAALDRTKEPGSQGEPLLMEVCTALQRDGRTAKVIGGRYGLSSKDFNPAMVKAIFDEMMKPEPKKEFTVGIDDDVTHLSLTVPSFPDPIPADTRQAIFYGMGSDGTVGATKQAVNIIGANTPLNAQAFFQYSAKKSGGYTICQLRFSKNKIHAAYQIQEADFVCCNKDRYVRRFKLTEKLTEGGVFVLNSRWTLADMEREFPASLKRDIARKKLRFYNVNAVDLAQKLGLGTRINMIMETVFFKLENIIPMEDAISYLKAAIKNSYEHEGEAVVAKNYSAVDAAIAAIEQIDYPASWADAVDEPAVSNPDIPWWITKLHDPMMRLEGDKIPVSLMSPDGVYHSGTTAYEKRTIAINVPQWNPERCIQCCQCSLVCAHAAIRPYLPSAEELQKAPDGFETVPTWGAPGMRFRIQVYPEDCTGCSSCAHICPGGALTMQPLPTQLETQKAMLAFAQKNVAPKPNRANRFSIRGSQMFTPLMEFSGACAGCGETPYVKLVTQLFGEHIVVANATGCSSIWGADSPSQSYCINENGHGPAWGNSLFEDNAEYAYGIYVGMTHRRDWLKQTVQEAVADAAVSSELKALLSQWLKVSDDCYASYDTGVKIKEYIEAHPSEKYCAEIASEKELLGRKTVWAFGGDGWAYDIGFAGLDHVLASGYDINFLVLDTQCYSNTGGQTSKATPFGAAMKYDYAGKRTFRKNLGEMMMTYRNVYVASVAIGGNINQTIQALREAEAYPGPSIVIAYCPCINFGIRTGMGTTIIEQRNAVINGFWPIYRFNPSAAENPLTIDEAAPVATPIQAPEAKPAAKPKLKPQQLHPKPWVHPVARAYAASRPRNGADNPLIVDNPPFPSFPLTPFLTNEDRYAVLQNRIGDNLAAELFKLLRQSTQGNLDRLGEQPS